MICFHWDSVYPPYCMVKVGKSPLACLMGDQSKLRQRFKKSARCEQVETYTVTPSIRFFVFLDNICSNNMNSGVNSLGAAAANWRSHDRDQLFHSSAFFHIAAGRGCARVVHAAIHVAAENNAFDNNIIPNNDEHNDNKDSDLAQKVPI